jgi:hypothetical protein
VSSNVLHFARDDVCSGSIATDVFAAGVAIVEKRTKGQNGRTAREGRGFYVAAYGHSFMPAIVALRCQSNKTVWSSWASGDGLAGTD